MDTRIDKRSFAVCVETMHKFLNENPNTEVEFLSVPIVTGLLFSNDSLIIWHKINLHTGEIFIEEQDLRIAY